MPARPSGAPQLPAKRRQVIRLPKPPASEWPKAPAGTKRRAPDGEDEDGSDASEAEEDEGDGGEGEGEGGDGASASTAAGSAAAAPKHMSAAHRTGLAKASAVIDWLMTALGVRGGRGAAAGRRDGDDDGGGEDGGVSGGGGGGAGADQGPKVLVFAHHKTVMNRVAAALEGATGYAPVSYVRIDGGTDPEDRWAWLGPRVVGLNWSVGRL